MVEDPAEQQHVNTYTNDTQDKYLSPWPKYVHGNGRLRADGKDQQVYPPCQIYCGGSAS
jgi:hypothetical protein